MAKKGPKKNAREESPEVEEEEYEVEKILDHKREGKSKKSELKYRVKWKGYDNEADHTWEPESNVVDTAPAAVERYWKGVPAGKRKERYAPCSKEYKALTEGTDGEEDDKPKKGGRRSRGAAETEDDDDEKPAKKRGRKSGTSTASASSAKKANGSTGRKARQSKASALSDDNDEEAAAPKKKPSSGAKKAVNKATTPEPEEDEVMEDAEEEEGEGEEEEEEEGDEEEVADEEETLEVDWKDYYADEENWEVRSSSLSCPFFPEQILNSVDIVHSQDLIDNVSTVKESPTDEDLSGFKTVQTQKAMRMHVVWQRGTAAYKKQEPAAEKPVVSGETGEKEDDGEAAKTGQEKVEAIVAVAEANGEPAPADAAKERTSAAAVAEGEGEGEKEKDADAADVAAEDGAPATGEDKVASIVDAAEKDAEPNAAEAVKDRHDNADAPVVNGDATEKKEVEANGADGDDDPRQRSSWVPGEIVRLRAPQKCLDFYESLLKFRTSGQAA
ncbi:hypothetical protein JCM11251_001351 [Rhodosporidiobolus azoricus]